MLAFSPRTLYVFEPFSSGKYKTLSIRSHELQGVFPCLTDQTVDDASLDFIETNLGLRRNYRAELKSVNSPRAFLRCCHRQVRYYRGRGCPSSSPWLNGLF